MGLFKQMNDVMGEAPEFVRSSMETQQARALSQLASSASSVTCPATVVAVRDTGQMVDDQPMVEVDVLVTPEGAVPWPATVSTIGHGQPAGLQVGVGVGVRNDPADSATIAFA